MNKLLTGTVLAGLSLCAFAADIPLTPEELVAYATQKVSKIETEGDTVVVTGWTMLASKQNYPCVEGKTYSIKGDFKGVPNTPDNIFYIGFIPLDAQKRVIDSHHANIVENSETKLTADVNPDDTFLMVEDGSKWVKGSLKAAFNAKADLSDLPNRTTSQSRVCAVEKTDNGWKITFTGRIGRTAKAGELVREHREGGYVYVAVAVKNSKGIVNPPTKIAKFYHGTKFIRIAVLANWTPVKEGDQPKLAIKNVCLTEE